MPNNTIRPSTMGGIKSLAKSIKTEKGIKHTQALDEAAREAGYHNFRHAKNTMGPGTQPRHGRPKHRVYITAYWRDREAGGDGRETLSIWISEPWGDLVTPSQLGNDRALGRFHSEGPDHLVGLSLVQSQSRARDMVCAAARTLQFMDATKLRPSNGYTRALPGGTWDNKVPGMDHYGVWYDRNTKRYVLADEPYEKAVEHQAEKRAMWAQRHGYAMVKPEWAGMYNPDGGSRLFLFSSAEKGIPLEPIVTALNKLPAPIVSCAWNGESMPTIPYFVSPGTIAKADEAEKQRKPNQSPKQSGQRNTVEYIQTFVGSQRRPKGSMSVDAHAEVGTLLKSVLVASYHRKGVYNRVNAVRSELDEWVQREYNDSELPNEQFFNLYYRETPAADRRSILPAERIRHLENLQRVKGILGKQYPDCRPLRVLFNKLDLAIKSMQTWS